MENNREVKEGQKYKHFKGWIIDVIEIAEHTETKEQLVIYKHSADNKIWARPLEMFLSEVDHEKYPDVKQKYRFELQEN